MIAKINKKDLKLPSEHNQSLNIISNLANYIVFLISDIIQHINNKDVKSLKINISKIEYKEITEFCFEILEALLFCNIKKKEKIKTSLIFDKRLNNIKTESDEIRIKQILLNLISNSVKFSNEGEIKLKCILKKFEGKFYVKISVIDTGIGIKEMDIKKLFKEFVQLENGHVENNKLGSGLGLSICKNIAKRLGFLLNVKSEYKKGSKFSLFIPVDPLQIEGNFAIDNRTNINNIDDIEKNKMDLIDRNFGLNSKGNITKENIRKNTGDIINSERKDLLRIKNEKDEIDYLDFNDINNEKPIFMKPGDKVYQEPNTNNINIENEINNNISNTLIKKKSTYYSNDINYIKDLTKGERVKFFLFCYLLYILFTLNRLKIP